MASAATEATQKGETATNSMAPASNSYAKIDAIREEEEDSELDLQSKVVMEVKGESVSSSRASSGAHLATPASSLMGSAPPTPTHGIASSSLRLQSLYNSQHITTQPSINIEPAAQSNSVALSNVIHAHLMSQLSGPMSQSSHAKFQPSESLRNSLVNGDLPSDRMPTRNMKTPSAAEVAAMIIPRYVPPAVRRRANSHMSSRFGRRVEDYELLDTIGTGTFGRVYLCRSRSGSADEYFAMKVLKKSDVVRLKQVEHINSEKSILSSVRHPFIVTLHTTFQDETNLYMLLEYVVGGELFSHLRRAGRFNNEVTRFFAAEIVLAVEYMHSRDIIYRDLKPENLLLDKDGHIKITDFGFAKRVEERTWTLCGTPEYLAPEIIQSKGHGKPVDWWALGILIFEMLAGYPPFFDDNPFGIYEKILAGRIQFPAHFHMHAKDIVRRLLTADRTQRLGNLRGGSADVKRHKWFRGIDWDALKNRAVRAPIQPRYRGPGDTGNFEKYPEGPQRDRNTPGAPDPYRHLFTEF